MDNNLNNIPVEKFRFAERNDLYHDSKFETKPVSYFQGAFQRFSKNKGAVVGGVVIAVLVLFAILAPFFTPFQPSYYDMVYAYVTPKLNVFADNVPAIRCYERLGFVRAQAIELEIGGEKRAAYVYEKRRSHG